MVLRQPEGISFLLASSFHPPASLLLDFLPGQIPDAHMRGYSLWPEHGLPQLIQPDGPGVPDTDFLLYVRVAHTSKCHQEVRVKAHPSSLLPLLIRNFVRRGMEIEAILLSCASLGGAVWSTLMKLELRRG